MEVINKKKVLIESKMRKSLFQYHHEDVIHRALLILLSILLSKSEVLADQFCNNNMIFYFKSETNVCHGMLDITLLR